MNSELSSMQRLQHNLDLVLLKDRKAWTDLCAEDVVAEFPLRARRHPLLQACSLGSLLMP
jgi:ketosteroid isomerase-like protein